MSFDFLRMAREGYDCWLQDRPEIIAFDTETTGLAFYDVPFCVTASWRRPNGELTSHYFELDADSEAITPTILNETRRLIGHNLKFDLQKTILAGLLDRRRLTPERLEETELLAHLLDEHRMKKLKVLAVEELDFEDELIEIPVKTGKNAGTMKLVPKEQHLVDQAKLAAKKHYGFQSVKEVGYHLLPREVIVPYALRDAEFTYRLWEVFRARLSHPDLLDLYEQERELLLVLLDMEAAGFRVDVPYAERTAKEYGGRVMRMENEIAALVGKPLGKNAKKGEFNPNSREQMMAAFAERGVTIADTQANTLRALDDPLALSVLELKRLAKLHGTYLLPLTREHRDGIIHPNFRQNVKTGRMSSGAEEG